MKALKLFENLQSGIREEYEEALKSSQCGSSFAKKSETMVVLFPVPGPGSGHCPKYTEDGLLYQSIHSFNKCFE